MCIEYPLKHISCQRTVLLYVKPKILEPKLVTLYKFLKGNPPSSVRIHFICAIDKKIEKIQKKIVLPDVHSLLLTLKQFIMNLRDKFLIFNSCLE